jgi:hypothetical protein
MFPGSLLATAGDSVHGWPRTSGRFATHLQGSLHCAGTARSVVRSCLGSTPCWLEALALKVGDLCLPRASGGSGGGVGQLAVHAAITCEADSLCSGVPLHTLSPSAFECQPVCR